MTTEPHPRPSNWEQFRAVYERILDKNPDERAMYEAAKDRYRRELGDDGENSHAS